jgi:putative membrane-bound dehydrogenase-like protein
MRSQHTWPGLGLVALAWFLLPAPAAAQIRDDDKALQTLKVPEGFEIRLFAGADICHNPTAIEVDIYGRVWVCEGMNYRHQKLATPLDPDADRIKVFEDTKGTGRADKVTVFCDKVPIVPMTVCVVGDQVHIGVSPEWWRFDGGSDRKNPIGKNKTVFLEGFKKGGGKGWVDHDHALHGICLGPDGRFYFTVGDVGMTVTDKSGVKHNPNGAVMGRVNLDGTRMRILADNFRNPYELAVDSFGRVFCSDNDDDGNAQVRICHVIEGGDYGYRHNPKLPPSPTRHHWHEDVPGVTPKILRTFAGSPCGIIVYEGKLLPERFVGSMIHCDSGAPQAVRAYHIKPSGASFTAEIENLVTSTDKWFRPVDVAHAPDGSLYIADWYDSGVGGHAFREREIGRIYHLTMKGAPPPAKVPSPDLKTIPGLLSTLMSPMPSVRHLAIVQLRERKNESLEPLTKMARSAKHPLERARALWVLWGMGEEGRKVILETLKDADPRFRAQAVRMLREDMEKNLDAILPLAGDENAEVRLEVTLALRELPTARAKAGLEQLVKKLDPADIWYMPTIGGAIKQREAEFIKELFAGLGKSAEEEARGVALARQLQRAETVPYLAAVLNKPAGKEAIAQTLEALSWISDPAAGEAIASLAIANAETGTVRIALDMLRRKLGGDWKSIAGKPVFEQLFARCAKEPTLVPPFLGLVGAAQAQAFVPKVIEMIDKSSDNPALQRAAIEALGQIKSPQTIEKLTNILKITQLDPKETDPPNELALAALNALHAMNAPQATQLVEQLVLSRGYAAYLRREAVKLLGRTPSGCKFLLTAVEKKQLPIDLKGDVSLVTNRSPDKAIRDLAAKLVPLPKLAGDRTLPPLDQILSKTGDVQKGQAVFFKQEAQCSKCHRVGGIGSWVGPDLSQAGAKFAKDGLLQKIIHPNASIAHGYRQYTVETQKGQLIAGLIVDESKETLVLKNAEGERIVLSAKDIASKVEMEATIMPEGLVQHLTDQELIDLLAYLGTLRQPSIPVATWNILGPLDAGNVPAGLEGKVDLSASYPGKGGTKVSWRAVGADREGRIDLEAALGTRQAAVFLHAAVVSKTAQEGKLVLLLPPDAKVTGWLDGKELKFTSPTATTALPKEGLPHSATLPLPAGKTSLVLKITGSDKAALAAVSTIVSPQGVELAGTK